MTDQEIFINEIKKREDFTILTAREINLMWQAWQASAQRKGYKLISIDEYDSLLKTIRDSQRVSRYDLRVWLAGEVE